VIRFLPDTWRDALLRPLAMASPDGGVYVEIMAPDFRFVFIVALALLWLLLARGKDRRASAALGLLAVTAIAFIPWLATTGNGRYFIPFLLIAGPLCIGLLQLTPASRTLRLALAVGMVGWQSFLIYEVSPWRTYHVEWGDAPPFEVEVPKDVAEQPATYVTLASISYSLIAPRFHPASRWINVSTQAGLADKSPDGLRTQALIAAPGPLNVIFPTVPGGQEGQSIDPDLGAAINGLLARHGLSVEHMDQCRLMRSTGLAGMASSRLSDEAAGHPGVHGFWLCPLARHAASNQTAQPSAVPARSERVFEKLERICPRIFPPGETVSLRIPSGAVRGYPGSDFKLYVLDDGEVVYKYYRALNPVTLGSADSVLDPAFTMDCEKIRGRSGLPWERGI
jgi:hypothetical protein